MRASHSQAYEAFLRTIRAPQRGSAASSIASGAASALSGEASGGTGGDRLSRLLEANALDEALWTWARARQCSDLRMLGLLDHPVVVRDLTLARGHGIGPCPK